MLQLRWAMGCTLPAWARPDLARLVELLIALGSVEPMIVSVTLDVPWAVIPGPLVSSPVPRLVTVVARLLSLLWVRVVLKVRCWGRVLRCRA